MTETERVGVLGETFAIPGKHASQTTQKTYSLIFCSLKQNLYPQVFFISLEIGRNF